MPSAPTDFQVLNVAVLHFLNGAISNKPAVLLWWTQETGTSAYVEMSANHDGPWALVKKDTSNSNARTMVIGKLPFNTARHFRMRSQNGDGFSPYSAVISVTLPAAVTAAPAEPSGLEASEITSYSVILTWEDNSDNEAYFVIELATGALTALVHVEGLRNSARIDVQSLFRSMNVAGQHFTARMKVIGGKASANKLPPYASDWGDPIPFQLLPPAIRIISPLTQQGEKGAEFSYTIATNTPATSWTATPLPSELTLSDAGVISGTPTVPGTFNITLTASNAVPSTDTVTLRLTILPSRVKFQNRDTAVAPLGKSFSLALAAAPAGVSFTAANLPTWLSLNTSGTATTLNGTPDDPGEYEVQVVGTFGPSSATQTIVITVPPVALITRPDLKGALGQDFAVTLTASPGGCVFTSEDLPEWLELSPEGVLSGTPLEMGDYTFDVTASLDDEGASATYTLKIGPLFLLNAEVEGALGRHVLEHISFEGFGVVTAWWLSNAPEGLELWDLMPAVGEPYYGSGLLHLDTQRRAIRGVPTESGPFVATISVNVLTGGEYKTYSVDMIFRITGGLYVSWFHAERTLYDLQVPIRGDAATRTVQSYYGVPSRSASTSSHTEGGVTTVTQNVAVEGNLLTLKRGDSSPQLGILIRDDVGIIGEGVTEVRLTLREADAEDGDYLFDIAAEPAALDTHTYFRAVFAVESEALDDAMSDDSLTRLAVLGELSWTYGGATYTSPTFTVTIVEDIHK